jgi:hypothetical protein
MIKLGTLQAARIVRQNAPGTRRLVFKNNACFWANEELSQKMNCNIFVTEKFSLGSDR